LPAPPRAPGTESNPNPLGPQPLPGRPGPERDAPPGPPRSGHKSGTSCSCCFGALTEVTAGGSSAPIGWWDGANRQAAPRRPHGGGRILTTCTFLRLGGRGAGSGPAEVEKGNEEHRYSLVLQAQEVGFFLRRDITLTNLGPRQKGRGTRAAACTTTRPKWTPVGRWEGRGGGGLAKGAAAPPSEERPPSTGRVQGKARQAKAKVPVASVRIPPQP
jgi:hypothetical protein